MFCKNCGSQLDQSGRCPQCERTVFAGTNTEGKIAGPAKASLIIGILSIFFGVTILLPLAGLTTAIIAILKISKGTCKGMGLVITGICLNSAGLFIGIMIIYGFVTFINEVPKHFGGKFTLKQGMRKMVCIGQLAQIDGQCRLYAKDNNNFLPPEDGTRNLRKVLKKYKFHLNANTSNNLFICPAFKDGNLATLQDGISPDRMTYVYFGGYKILPLDKLHFTGKGIPIIFDYPGNHKGYVNIVYLNGKLDSFLTKAEDSVTLIKELHLKHKYSPENLKRLLKKAAKADQDHIAEIKASLKASAHVKAVKKASRIK